MRTNQKKKWLFIFLSCLLVFASIPLTTSADENNNKESSDMEIEPGEYTAKDEVIYGNLDANGNAKNMYVVNTFHVTVPGEIVDYGDYTNVRNLTNLSDIEQIESAEVHFQTEEEEFYYQGELENKPLPWDISITYLLNNEKMNTDELAGQSGNLEIQITTSANEDVDPLFFENYLLQISLSLDPTIFNDIQAPEGTEANEGKNKQITFTVMPEQEEELIVSAYVTDLEMDPINISAIPANIAIENPDIGNMTGDMESLSDAISMVNAGVAELSNGISELNAGVSELSKGSSDYQSGINELDQSSGELVNGSKEIRDALKQISESMQGNSEMPNLDDMKELPKGLREIAKGLRNSGDGLDTLSENYNDAYGALDEAIGGIPDYNISEEQIEKLYESNADTKVVDQLVKTYSAAQAVKQTYDAVKEGFTAVSDTLEQVSGPLHDMATQLETMADGMDNGMDNLEQIDALADLQNGLTALSSEYTIFHNGLVSYTEGVNSLATSFQKLDTGIQELSDGTAALDSGANDLHDGTKELRKSTSDLPGQMQSEVDELMEEYDNSDFEPVSFVSEQNEKVNVVQFVLQTEAIEMEEPESTEQEEEEEKSFWDRFLDLFR